MSATRDQQIMSLFLALVDRGADERRAMLDEQCVNRPDVASEVRSLLASADAGSDPLDRYLEDCGLAPRFTMDPSSRLLDAAGDDIGPYRLVEVLGTGGFGVVWKAVQHAPVQRAVAIKIVHEEMAWPGIVQRFQAEQQALADLPHDNIARLYDTGALPDGRPFFVMELVDGPSITDFVRAGALSVDARLALFRGVCDGIAYAHQKGIIHRDIKPENVLIATGHAEPVPKVIDFGIAKVLGDSGSPQRRTTRLGWRIGTPACMAPEQLGAELAGPDVRSDVYALGVLLYEMLTGAPPFDRTLSGGELIRAICDVDPPRPSARMATRSDRKRLANDLDCIVMTCLEKERARRYPTVDALVADIDRHMRHEPIVAAPASRRYRLRKFLRRHTALVSLGVLLLISVGFGLSATMVGWAKAMEETARAERELVRATDIKDLLVQMLRSIDAKAVPSAEARASLARVLDAASGRLRVGEVEDELDEAELHDLVGHAYRMIRDAENAEHHFRQAIEIRERRLGDDDRLTLATMRSLAALYWGFSRYDSVEVIQVEILERTTRSLGEGHEDTRAARSDLLSTYNNQGRYLDALPLREAEFDHYTRTYGAEDERSLKSATSLAALYVNLWRNDEAITLLEHVVSCRRSAGRDDFDAFWATQSLANAYAGRRGAGRAEFARSIELYEEAIEGFTALRGEECLERLWCVMGLAGMHRRLGALGEAESLLRDTLAVFERSGHADHSWAFHCVDRLAGVLREQGRLREAESLSREALALRRKHMGVHRDTTDSMEQLAWLCQLTGNLEEAESLRREALEARRAEFGTDHPRSVEALRYVIAVLHKRGRFDEAAPFEEELRALQERHDARESSKLSR